MNGTSSNCANQQQVVNPKTGKVERVFVNLEAVYPNLNDPNEEMSFEELRAAFRGWMGKDWAAEREQRRVMESQAQAQAQEKTLEDAEVEYALDTAIAEQLQHDLVINSNEEIRSEAVITKGCSREGRTGRPRKMRTMEVKGETQTSWCPLP